MPATTAVDPAHAHARPQGRLHRSPSTASTGIAAVSSGPSTCKPRSSSTDAISTGGLASTSAVFTDGTKLFIYGAGYRWRSTTPETLQLRSDIDTPGDITTNMVVLPSGGGDVERCGVQCPRGSTSSAIISDFRQSSVLANYTTNPRNRIPFAQYKRAFAYVAPYWREVLIVLLLGLFSTAVGLVQPYISRLLIDDALLKHDLYALGEITVWDGGCHRGWLRAEHSLQLPLQSGFPLRVCSTCVWRSTGTCSSYRRATRKRKSSAISFWPQQRYRRSAAHLLRHAALGTLERVVPGRQRGYHDRLELAAVTC